MDEFVVVMQLAIVAGIAGIGSDSGAAAEVARARHVEHFPIARERPTGIAGALELLIGADDE
jgi:hypothetical protein